MSARFDEKWRVGFPSPAACRFVSAEDVMAIALKAHLAAVRHQAPPPGEPWMDAGVAWSGPEDFYNSLLREFDQRLRVRAIERGHLALVPWTPEQYAEQAECEAELAEWEAKLEAKLAGAGRSPADEGQGCPALLPAVGPAATSSHDADITDPDTPFFVASGMQELPSGDTPVNTPETGDANHVR